jgi:hypothetical protein
MIQKIISYLRKINLRIVLLTILTILPWKLTINHIGFSILMKNGLIVLLNSLPVVNLYVHIFYFLVLFFVVYFSYYYILHLITYKTNKQIVDNE